LERLSGPAIFADLGWKLICFNAAGRDLLGARAADVRRAGSSFCAMDPVRWRDQVQELLSCNASRTTFQSGSKSWRIELRMMEFPGAPGLGVLIRLRPARG
jgi:hypothetical protein